MDKYDFLLKNKTVTDVALVGYMTFLNEKGLLEEGKKYVEGFIGSLSKEDFIELARRTEKMLEQAIKKNDASTSTEK